MSTTRESPDIAKRRYQHYENSAYAIKRLEFVGYEGHMLFYCVTKLHTTTNTLRLHVVRHCTFLGLGYSFFWYLLIAVPGYKSTGALIKHSDLYPTFGELNNFRKQTNRATGALQVNLNYLDLWVNCR